jgi:hypothetical protein
MPRVHPVRRARSDAPAADPPVSGRVPSIEAELAAYVGVDDQCLPPNVVARWAELGGRALRKAVPGTAKQPERRP